MVVEPLARGQRGADRAGVRPLRDPGRGRAPADAAQATALGRALLGAGPLRAARARARRGPRTCSTTCARRGCSRARGGRPARGRGPTARAAHRPARPARAGPRASSPESSTLSASPRIPARSWPRQARRLLAAPHRGRAPVLDPAEELDARAVAALGGRWPSSSELGVRPSGAELIELLETLELAGRRRAPVRRGGARAPIRSRSGPGASGPCSCAAFRRASSRSAAAPEPFLSDELRRELAACSGLRLRPREDALARERYLFYTSVSRATERVVLSYRSSDEEGNLALPSPFLADVAELLAEDWPERRRRRLLADVVWPAAAAPTERELARSRAAAAAPASGEVPSPIGSLGEAALAHVRHSQIVSAGALETYADCPVKWLVERELQPAPLEPDPDAARPRQLHARGARAGAPAPRRAGHPRVAPARAGAPRRGARRAARTGSPPGRGEAVRAAVVPGGGRRPAALPGLRGARRLDWPTRRPRAAVRLRSAAGAGLAAGPRARATTCACAGSSTASTPTARAGRSSATTRADGPPRAPGRALADRPPAPGRAVHARRPRAARARAGRRLLPAAGRRRSARARRVRQGGRRPATVWSATTAGTRTSSRSCSRRRAAGRSRWRRGCAPARSSRARRRARATGAATPGSAVLELSETETDAHAFTDEQLAAIERREGDLLLDAGAGSGKTSVLVERFVRSVLEDEIEVAAILTITFTEKAAAEMRERIRRRLRESRLDSALQATRRRAPPRARSSRRSTASARGCCAPTRWPPGSTRRSRCSTRPTPSGWPTPRSRTRSRRSGAPARAPTPRST